MPFVFDGRGLVLESGAIRQLWPPLVVGSNRPVGLYSFAVNYALHGEHVAGYHLTNIAIHVVAAWLLFEIVRRGLRSSRLEGRYDFVAGPLALTAAMLWLVHPLQTQSVTYLYQRYESLMGMFFLLAVYGFFRAQESARPHLCYAGSVIAFALGVATKEVAVVAPAVILWLDRALFAHSWRELWRRRWAYYATMSALLLAPAAFIFSSRDFYRGGGVLTDEVSSFDYALSQPAVVLHYLRLSFWPAGQVLDYAWPVAVPPTEIALPLLAIGLLIGLTIWAAVRAPAMGALGGWFFLILAPTSSFAPIKDLAFEHRMYLPLAAV
ncbi:MAG: hypothetical protein ACOY3P_01870, partial [Planctomycetota bacterium]